MARSNITHQLVGSSFTLMELEQFVHRARDLGLPVDSMVQVHVEKADRPGSSDEYILSVTGSAPSHPQPDALSKVI